MADLFGAASEPEVRAVVQENVPAAECPEVRMIADNSELKAGAPGVQLRLSPSMSDKDPDPDSVLRWGEAACGERVPGPDGGDWVQLPTGKWVPVFVGGHRVLLEPGVEPAPAAESTDENARSDVASEGPVPWYRTKKFRWILKIPICLIMIAPLPVMVQLTD